MAAPTKKWNSLSQATRKDAGKLLEVIASRHVPQAIHAIGTLGIADLVADGPKSCRELASATGSHEHTLYRVLRILVAARIFAQDKTGRFRLTPLGRPLRSDVPESVRAASVFLSGESELEGHLVD